ncbi:5'-nucleotidase C-terminal domain-containing protein [Ochrovirga pacifica]|uniref:5'-nucleotidase C-terminal domain-containing protein n=1 Tax=Ochrovirga pacifica TaxID=1042376 RepID=UPI00049634CF|nr:5'-nucleotidase [Ochrovirga pacifica]
MKTQLTKVILFICGWISFVSCKNSTQQLSKIVGKNIAIDSAMVANTAIDSMIAPYKTQLDREMQQILTYTPVTLQKKTDQQQSNLGNLMADLTYQMAQPIFQNKTKQTIDFALFNSGGIRALISKGNVTKEHAFKLMPFENQLVVVQLSGKKTEELIHYFIQGKKAHPLSKQIKLTIHNDQSYELSIRGQKFDPNKNYLVLTSDYLQHGGDGMDFFKNPIALTKIDLKVRDAIIQYFKKTDTLKARIDHRITLD